MGLDARLVSFTFGSLFCVVYIFAAGTPGDDHFFCDLKKT